MLHVLAYITAKPGMRETVLREFRANMPAVHAEEACIEYVPVVDLPGHSELPRPNLGQTPLSWSRNGRALKRSKRTQPPRT